MSPEFSVPPDALARQKMLLDLGKTRKPKGGLEAGSADAFDDLADVTGGSLDNALQGKPGVEQTDG